MMRAASALVAPGTSSARRSPSCAFKRSPGRGLCVPIWLLLLAAWSVVRNRGASLDLDVEIADEADQEALLAFQRSSWQPGLGLVPQRAPELVESRVAAAARGVELVANRVLLVVVLVIVFRRPEFAGGHDRGDDRLLEGFLLVPFGLGGLGEPLLLLGVIEDRGAILRPDVAELPVLDRRVVVEPELLEQPFIAHLRGVVNHLHDFGVAGPAGGYLRVGRVLLGPAHVAGGRRDHPRYLVESLLRAPEAPGREGGRREVSGRGLREHGGRDQRCETHEQTFHGDRDPVAALTHGRAPRGRRARPGTRFAGRPSSGGRYDRRRAPAIAPRPCVRDRAGGGGSSSRC